MSVTTATSNRRMAMANMGVPSAMDSLPVKQDWRQSGRT